MVVARAAAESRLASRSEQFNFWSAATARVTPTGEGAGGGHRVRVHARHGVLIDVSSVNHVWRVPGPMSPALSKTFRQSVARSRPIETERRRARHIPAIRLFSLAQLGRRTLSLRLFCRARQSRCHRRRRSYDWFGRAPGPGNTTSPEHVQSAYSGFRLTLKGREIRCDCHPWSVAF